MLGMCSPEESAPRWSLSTFFISQLFVLFLGISHPDAYQDKKKKQGKNWYGKNTKIHTILSDISNLLKNIVSISLKEVQGLDEQRGMIKLLSEESVLVIGSPWKLFI